MAFQAGYAKFSKQGGEVLAISGDDRETMRSYKKSLGAKFPLIPDPEGALMELFGVKYPLFTVASRYSFVVGDGRRVVKVFSGGEAIDAEQALAACTPLFKSKALEAAKKYGEEYRGKERTKKPSP